MVVILLQSETRGENQVRLEANCSEVQAAVAGLVHLAPRRQLPLLRRLGGLRLLLLPRLRQLVVRHLRMKRTDCE